MTSVPVPVDHNPSERPETLVAAASGQLHAKTTVHDATAAREDPAARVRSFAETDYRRVVAALAAWTGSFAEAQDAVDEALARSWERLDRGKAIDNLAAFVTTCAMNRLRSTSRRRAVFLAKRHLLFATDRTEPDETIERRLT
ncbi:MAG: hypothetical protein JST73_08980 [Actinobacteria bacterium]|nr:hypothetical protein [Actinomycetota bacterium]